MKQFLGYGVLLCILFFSASVHAQSACSTFSCTVPTPTTNLLDTDCDGIADSRDNCDDVKNGNCNIINPNGNYANCDADCDQNVSDQEFSAGSQADADDNGIGDACDDRDQDGIVDNLDLCPLISDPIQQDTDQDGIGDACEDTDHDLLVDSQDNCPLNYNPLQGDIDQDNIGDACDKCRFTSDSGLDSDGDGVGDACEGDRDVDTILDGNDNCPDIPNTLQENIDRDRFGDVCDNCPALPNNDQSDRDADGIGDACALDPDITPDPFDDGFGTPQGLQPQGGGGCSSSLAPTASSSSSMLGFLMLGLFTVVIRFSRLGRMR